MTKMDDASEVQQSSAIPDINNDKIENCTWSKMLDKLSPLVLITLENMPKENRSEESFIEHIWEKNVTNLNQISKWIDVWIIKESNKNEKQSYEYRSIGNECFKSNKLKDSAYFYTKSILAAPLGSVQLALAFANRSAVEFQYSNYDKCINDIKHCLNNTYPDSLKHKVFLRLAHCYCNIGNFLEAQNALDGATIWLLKANISQINKGEIKKNLNSLQLKINEKAIGFKQKLPVISIPEPAYGNNAEFLYASNAISVRHSQMVGRYVIAVKDIKKGDILFSEDPYAAVLVEKRSLSCFHCGINCKRSALPCTNCSNVSYCSEKCQQLAWDLYHRWECVALSSELLYSVGIGSLALKVLLKGSHVNFNSKQDLTDISSSTNNYASVYNLVSNIDKMKLEDVSLYSLTAVMLITYLEKKTDFFQWCLTKCSMDVIKFKKYISSLLLRHMCQIQCNACVLPIRNKNRDVGKNYISALCPSTSMMNHSCDSNIVTDFYNYRLIVRAAKDINIGEEITNSYGTQYTVESFENRQLKLSTQYYFTCKCVICSSDDYEIKYYYELFNAFKCTQCGGRVLLNNTVCFDCKCTVIINFEKYNAGCHLEQKGMLSRALMHFERCLHENNIKLRHICEKIAYDYEDSRKYEKALTYQKKILKMLSTQFGENSISVTKQMIKTCFIMLKHIQVLEFQHSLKFKHETITAIKFMKKTKERMAYIYGPWNYVSKMVKKNLETAEKLLEGYNRRIIAM